MALGLNPVKDYVFKTAKGKVWLKRLKLICYFIQILKFYGEPNTSVELFY